MCECPDWDCGEDVFVGERRESDYRGWQVTVEEFEHGWGAWGVDPRGNPWGCGGSGPSATAALADIQQTIDETMTGACYAQLYPVEAE